MNADKNERMEAKMEKRMSGINDSLMPSKWIRIIMGV